MFQGVVVQEVCTLNQETLRPIAFQRRKLRCLQHRFPYPSNKTNVSKKTHVLKGKLTWRAGKWKFLKIHVLFEKKTFSSLFSLPSKGNLDERLRFLNMESENGPWKKNIFLECTVFVFHVTGFRWTPRPPNCNSKVTPLNTKGIPGSEALFI